MSNYIQDPNNPKKQIPGPNPTNYYGKAVNPSICTFTKQPNAVVVNTLLTEPVGFYFGSSQSFADLGAAGQVLAANYTTMLDDAPVGTTLNINPSALSGSADDADSITFVYRGGLDGSGRI